MQKEEEEEEGEHKEFDRGSEEPGSPLPLTVTSRVS